MPGSPFITKTDTGVFAIDTSDWKITSCLNTKTQKPVCLEAFTCSADDIAELYYVCNDLYADGALRPSWRPLTFKHPQMKNVSITIAPETALKLNTEILGIID